MIVSVAVAPMRVTSEGMTSSSASSVRTPAGGLDLDVQTRYGAHPGAEHMLAAAGRSPARLTKSAPAAVTGTLDALLEVMALGVTRIGARPPRRSSRTSGSPGRSQTGSSPSRPDRR